MDIGDAFEAMLRANAERCARYLPDVQPETPRTHYSREHEEIWVYDGSDDGYYEISLHRLRNAAALLDFVLQISVKNWSNREAALEFLECVDAVCRERMGETAQGVFCPFEQPMLVDWAANTYRRAKFVAED